MKIVRLNASGEPLPDTVRLVAELADVFDKRTELDLSVCVWDRLMSSKSLVIKSKSLTNELVDRSLLDDIGGVWLRIEVLAIVFDIDEVDELDDEDDADADELEHELETVKCGVITFKLVLLASAACLASYFPKTKIVRIFLSDNATSR